MKRRILPTGLALIALLAPTALALGAEEAVASGTWTKKGYRIAGNWSLIVDNGARYLVLDEGFKTRKAPDLKFFLSPRPLADLGDRNALDGGAVLIAPLEAPRGAQRYALPDDVDLAAFKTLILHCEQYSKLWGGAALGLEP
ncbi:MAG: DM13 domain-containing protein [Acidobacteriota bacterium]